VPRPPRIQLGGATYHVSSKSSAKRPIFLDRSDRELFMSILAMVVRRHSWSCTAYCLMTTHYHLLVKTPKPDLAAGMQRLNGFYASSFNHRHGTSGHVLGSRYHSELIETDGHLLEACRYIALNPVRAGLCEEPESWGWGSYRAAIGLAPADRTFAVDALLRLFAPEPDRARARLRTFVEDRML
jgi:putative transposase